MLDPRVDAFLKLIVIGPIDGFQPLLFSDKECLAWPISLVNKIRLLLERNSVCTDLMLLELNLVNWNLVESEANFKHGLFLQENDLIELIKLIKEHSGSVIPNRL